MVSSVDVNCAALKQCRSDLDYLGISQIPIARIRTYRKKLVNTIIILCMYCILIS